MRYAGEGEFVLNKRRVHTVTKTFAVILAIAFLAGSAAFSSSPRVSASGSPTADGSLPGNGVVPSSVVDVPSCVSFLTGGGADADGANGVCQGAADLTQLFGGSLTFNKVFSCSYAQSANIVAGGQIDRAALASCLGLPNS